MHILKSENGVNYLEDVFIVPNPEVKGTMLVCVILYPPNT